VGKGRDHRGNGTRERAADGFPKAFSSLSREKKREQAISRTRLMRHFHFHVGRTICYDRRKERGKEGPYCEERGRGKSSSTGSIDRRGSLVSLTFRTRKTYFSAYTKGGGERKEERVRDQNRRNRQIKKKDCEWPLCPTERKTTRGRRKRVNSAKLSH